jgi:hypothetical protein
MVVAHIPKDRLCFGPSGVLGFHQSRLVFNGTDKWMTDPAGTQWMIEQYPDDIRDWIKTKGGIKKMTVENMWTLRRANFGRWATASATILPAVTPAPPRRGRTNSDRHTLGNSRDRLPERSSHGAMPIA